MHYQVHCIRSHAIIDEIRMGAWSLSHENNDVRVDISARLTSGSDRYGSLYASRDEGPGWTMPRRQMSIWSFFRR